MDANQDMMDVDDPLGLPVAGPSGHFHSLLAEEEENDRVTELHSTAGKVIQIDQTIHEKWRQQFGLSEEEDEMRTEGTSAEDEHEGDHLFYPFASKLDWEVACWAVQKGIGHKAFDRLLAIPGVSNSHFREYSKELTMFYVRERLGLEYH
jgi:hypothetical protein